MPKPMQFTIVSAVPLYCASEFCATNVENCGLSATTAAPQIKSDNKKINLGNSNKKGDKKHSNPEIIKLTNATALLPL